jgi:hypothetical protein
MENFEIKIKNFLTFVCCGQSGHSIIASIIDAHPNALISDERKYIYKTSRRGWKRDRILEDLIGDSTNRVNRPWTKRMEVVGRKPLQWQGRVDRELLLVGDKCGWDNFGLYNLPSGDNKGEKRTWGVEKLEKNMGVPVLAIHALRNPFDIISNWYNGGRKYEQYRRDPNGMERLIKRYISTAEITEALYYGAFFQRENLLQIKNEELCESPKSTIRKILKFINLPEEEEYVKECASVIFPNPHRRVSEANWSVSLIEKVEKEVIGKFTYLSDYSFDGKY